MINQIKKKLLILLAALLLAFAAFPQARADGAIQSVRVWPCTPSEPLTSSTAQSSTESVRSVSAEKSL